MGESGTAYLAVTCQSLALVQTQAKADSMSDLNSSDMSHFQAKCDAKNAARSLGIIEQRERERGREGETSRGRGEARVQQQLLEDRTLTQFIIMLKRRL